MTNLTSMQAKGAAPLPRASRWLPVALAGVVAASWLTAVTFRAPVEVTEKVTDQEIRLDAKYNHFVTPQVSNLYPEPKPLKNEQSSYLRLVDKLDLEIYAALTATPVAQFDGSAEIVAKVVAPERWERTFVLRPSRPLRSNGATDRLVVFQETLRLPLEEYREFINLVEDETRVTPRDDYQIVVTPIVEVAATGGPADVTERFEFPFTFRLAGNTLVADTRLEQQLSGKKTREVTSAGAVKLAGLDLPVIPLRIASTALTTLVAGAFVFLTWQWRQAAAKVPELQRILQRYRSRLIEAQSDRQLTWGNAVSTNSFQDLLRIADQLDQTIFVVRQGAEVRFMVIDGETEYSFRPITADRTFPPKRAIGSMRPTQPLS